MIRISCHEYGFNCDFVLDDEIDQVVKKYNEHSEQIHGIEYVKEDLEQRFLELSNSQQLNNRIKISK